MPCDKVVKPLTAEEVPQVASIFVKAFCYHHPLTSHLKIPEATLLEFYEKAIWVLLDGGFSCCVHDAKTDKLIGCGTGHLYSADPLDKIGRGPLAQQPLLDLEDMLTPPTYIKEADPKTVLILDMVASIPLEEGGQKGISEAVYYYTLGLAKQRGIRYIMCILESPQTRHLYLDKFGFKEVDEIVFSESGIPQYKDLPGKAILAVQDLSTSNE